MTSLSCRKTTSILLLWALFAVAPAFVRSQDSTEGTRKVLTKVAPKYPPIARKMNITGVVRIEALVAPNGAVKSISVKGGHPLLAQAAQDSIRDWKWEPSSHETHELIEVKFENPN
jgi:TonB family protein